MKSFYTIFFWPRVAWLFLIRSGRSTLALSLMIVVAVSALIFLSAMVVGINDAMIQNSVGLYSGHISGVALPFDLKKSDLMHKGVSAVLKRVLVSGKLFYKNNTETVTMVCVNPDEEVQHTAIWKKMVQGQYLGTSDQDVILSVTMADRLNLQPGDILCFYSKSTSRACELKVAGVYQTKIDSIDREFAFCTLGAPFITPSAWSAAIFLEKGAEPESIINTYQHIENIPTSFKSWEEMMPDLKQLIILNYVSMGVVMAIVFGVVSLGIACAFVIFILKNIREYGIMKAMGVKHQEITFLIVAEVVWMNLISCCAGVILGVLAVLFFGKTGIDFTSLTSFNRYFSVSGIVFPRLSLYALVLPPALAMISGILAAVWPVVMVMRKQAAEILRVV
jgi:ABC-type lipoprotein release transport system permease subunit